MFHPSDQAAIQAAAARWAVRRDRGLSSREAIEFELWLAADPRHAAALEQSSGVWESLDRVPEFFAQCELARAARRRDRRRKVILFGSLAAAAGLALTVWQWRPALEPTGFAPPANPKLLAAGPREVALADGSLVKLNAGSEVSEEFTADERRVRLTRGEAHFTVVPDATRPFVVQAGRVSVRAVGTAFNVNLQSVRVEVLVTEGKVTLEAPERAAETVPPLSAGDRAVVSSAADREGGASAVVVHRVDAAEMSRALAWQSQLVRLGGATLGDVVADFERRFGQRVTIDDPAIAQLRAGGRLRVEHPDDLARVLATTFDLAVEREADGGWRLTGKKANSR